MLMLAVERDDEIVISDMLIQELMRFYPAEVESFFLFLHTSKVRLTPEEIEEAKTLVRTRGVSFGDAAHAVLARDHDCILVTLDKGFSLLADIREPHTPEDIFI